GVLRVDENVERVDRNVVLVSENVERVDRNVGRVDRNVERVDRNVQVNLELHRSVQYLQCGSHSNYEPNYRMPMMRLLIPTIRNIKPATVSPGRALLFWKTLAVGLKDAIRLRKASSG